MVDPAILNRRSAIGLVAASAALVGASAPALASRSQVSPALLDLIEARRRTAQAWDAYHDAAFNPMEEGLFAALEAVPHETTMATFKNHAGDDQRLTTEPWSVGMARRIVEDGRHVAPDHMAATREVIALAVDRDQRLAAIRARFHEDEIRTHADALGRADTLAGNAVALFPAAHLADVIAKLRWIIDADWWEMAEAQPGIMADLGRLQQREAAHG